MGISFRRPQHKFFTTLWNAPKPAIGGTVQAEKISVAKEILLWGCPGMNFRATLPFYGMIEIPISRDCGLLKEILMAPDIDTLFSTCMQERPFSG
jgi:hypothetical protein